MKGKMDIKPINKINKLLLKELDPIGIGNMPEAEDEYFHYAQEVYRIIQASNSYRELFEYLWELETQHMGLKGNKIDNEKFAQLLFKKIKKSSAHQHD